MISKKKDVPELKVKKEKPCDICGSLFLGNSNYRYCSQSCRKVAQKNQQISFAKKNPDAMKGYNKKRIEKNSSAWRDKWDKERKEIILILGGKCCVQTCNVTNRYHLHIDYIPTMKGTGFRHPRHRRWVIDHIDSFRLLCANHHYELTLTGKIEGTKITQSK